MKMLAVLLIVGGILGLTYGGFSYSKETHTANIGDLHIAIAEKQHVNVPMWAGLASIVAGVLLLASARKA